MPTESFFSQASLALIASGGAEKDGKVYSIKPTDGSGDFTFSRGSNLAATRVGPTGLIEKGRENLFTYSNDFSNANWKSSGTTETSGQSGYDGSSDAWLLSAANVNGFIYRNDITSFSGVMTISVYAKKGTADGIRLRFNQTTDVNLYINLAAGAIIGAFSPGIAYAIEDALNGWYRIQMSFIASGPSDVRIYPTNATGTSIAGTIYIQDAQAEIGLAATEVIESGATKGTAGILERTPRFDYSGGATCPSLLLEPSRAQLLAQTEYFDSSSWTKDAGTTLTTNAAISPDGSQNATRFESPLSSKGLFTYGAVNNQTISIYIKAGNTDNIGKSVNLFTTTISQGFVLTDEWQRISVSGGASNLFALYPSSGDGINAFIWGAQAEAATTATSYIPNHAGGTITRAADAATTGDISSLVNSPEGTFFTEFAKVDDFDGVLLSDGTLNNRITLYPRNNTAQITFIFAVGSVEVIRQNPSPSGLNTTEFNKYAIAWGLNDFRVYVNGVKIYTSTSNITFSSGVLNDLELSSANHKQSLIFQTALSDADCITLTT